MIERWRGVFGYEGGAWRGGKDAAGMGGVGLFIEGMECVRVCFVLALKAAGAREEAAARGKRLEADHTHPNAHMLVHTLFHVAVSLRRNAKRLVAQPPGPKADARHRFDAVPCQGSDATFPGPAFARLEAQATLQAMARLFAELTEEENGKGEGKRRRGRKGKRKRKRRRGRGRMRNGKGKGKGKRKIKRWFTDLTVPPARDRQDGRGGA